MESSVSTGGPAIWVRIPNSPSSTWWALQPLGIRVLQCPTSMACLTHLIPAEGNTISCKGMLKDIDSGSVPLFLWTPHRLVAVDGVDTFHPGFGLLFVAVENRRRICVLCTKRPWRKGNNDHVVSVYFGTREMSSLQFRIWDFILFSSFLILSSSNIVQIDFMSTSSFAQIRVTTALTFMSRRASLSLLLLVF